MALNIIALLLVLGITFMHSIFGLYSGMINVFCSVVAAAVALGFFEPLNALVTGQFGLHPAYSEPICIVVLFILTLVLLRAAADGLIRGNVRLPMYVDWGGGAVCGFVNAQIAVGILVIGMLMLPIGGTVMGFSRYERDSDSSDERGLARFRRNTVWMNPDGFTVGLVSMLSNGVLRGNTAFASVYPDFMDEVFYTTNTVQPQSTPAVYRDSKGDGWKNGIKVEEWWAQTKPVDGRYRKGVPTKEDRTPPYSAMTFKPDPGKKLIGVRVGLQQASADRDATRPVHLFRPSMFRLVGERGDETVQYPARIITGADLALKDNPRIVDLDNNLRIDSGNASIDAYFEVDEDCTPRFVEYRRHARAALPPLDAKKKKEGPTGALVAAGDGGGESASSGGRSGGRGAMRFVDLVESGSGDNDFLPFKLSQAKLRGEADVELEADLFVSGRVVGSRAQWESKAVDGVVEKIKIPDGHRICKISFKPREVKTLVGQVLNWVAARVNQYSAIDETGDKYFMSGYYAIVKRDGEEAFELFFNGDPQNPKDPGYKAMLDFKDIKPSELEQEDAVMGMLFVIPVGKEVRGVQNQTGQGTIEVLYKMRKE